MDIDIKDLKVGELIEVELRSGDIMIGTFNIHPLAEECILNKNGFPIKFKRCIRRV